MISHLDIHDRPLDMPIARWGTEMLRADDWDAPTIRCRTCKRVCRAIGRLEWDDTVGRPHGGCGGDITPVCAHCGGDWVDVLSTDLGPCDRCGSELVEHDRTDWCHTCGIASELDDALVMGRAGRAITDDVCALIREITRDQVRT